MLNPPLPLIHTHLCYGDDMVKLIGGLIDNRMSFMTKPNPGIWDEPLDIFLTLNQSCDFEIIYDLSCLFNWWTGGVLFLLSYLGQLYSYFWEEEKEKKKIKSYLRQKQSYKDKSSQIQKKSIHIHNLYSKSKDKSSHT